MKIEHDRFPTGTIEGFADRYDLVMKVTERRASDLPRYFAHFAHCEVTNGNILSGVCGNGTTTEEAIRDYARRISMSRLVIDAYKNTRREIDAWRFTTEPEVSP